MAYVFTPYTTPPVLVCSYAAIANLVVIEAFSAIDRDMYCILTPCDWRSAIVIDAMWTPHLTAAVANPLRRLCIVALNHPKTPANCLSTRDT